ncbi:MAG: cytochrome c [Thermoflexales bacterium]|nr:cytochrome c [Thermoflexales bacterium]
MSRRTAIILALVATLAASIAAVTRFATLATNATATEARIAPGKLEAAQRAAGVYAVPALDPALVERGRTVYAESCARCHGAQLEGQNGWAYMNTFGRYMAPAHSDIGHTWQHADATLLNNVMFGIEPEHTEMQGFRGILSSLDQAAALAYIKSRWSEPVRSYQHSISLENHYTNETGH